MAVIMYHLHLLLGKTRVSFDYIPDKVWYALERVKV